MGLTVELAPEVEARLVHVAHRAGESSEHLAQRAIETFLDSVYSEPPDDAPDDELLGAIQQGMPETFWQRYDLLSDRRDDGLISEDELSELIQMCGILENESARRLKYLLILSKRRNTDVRSLMWELDLKPRDAYAPSN